MSRGWRGGRSRGDEGNPEFPGKRAVLDGPAAPRGRVWPGRFPAVPGRGTDLQRCRGPGSPPEDGAVRLERVNNDHEERDGVGGLGEEREKESCCVQRRQGTFYLPSAPRHPAAPRPLPSSCSAPRHPPAPADLSRCPPRGGDPRTVSPGHSSRRQVPAVPAVSPYRGQHPPVGTGGVGGHGERGRQQRDGSRAQQRGGSQEICQGQEEQGPQLGTGHRVSSAGSSPGSGRVPRQLPRPSRAGPGGNAGCWASCTSCPLPGL